MDNYGKVHKNIGFDYYCQLYRTLLLTNEYYYSNTFSVIINIS